MLDLEVPFTVKLKTGRLWYFLASIFYVGFSFIAPDWREEVKTSFCLIGYLIAIIIPVFICMYVLSTKDIHMRADLSATVTELLNVY